MNDHRSNVLNYKTFILQNDRISTMIQSFLERSSPDRAVIIIFLYGAILQYRKEEEESFQRFFHYIRNNKDYVCSWVHSDSHIIIITVIVERIVSIDDHPLSFSFFFFCIHKIINLVNPKIKIILLWGYVGKMYVYIYFLRVRIT